MISLYLKEQSRRIRFNPGDGDNVQPVDAAEKIEGNPESERQNNGGDEDKMTITKESPCLWHGLSGSKEFRGLLIYNDFCTECVRACAQQKASCIYSIALAIREGHRLKH